MLAPRINAAGRIGQIELAVQLFLTEDPQEAVYLAQRLCDLNRQRQAVESEIFTQAVQMFPAGKPPQAIVLADESWHQGVVGIVASRLAEEYCCPTFLICLDGEHGKASSRSYGGFNLFSSLTSLSHLSESYGGRETFSGFTIHRDRIPEFRTAVCRLAEEYYDDAGPRTALDIDCAIPPEVLTMGNVDPAGVHVLDGTYPYPKHPCPSFCNLYSHAYSRHPVSDMEHWICSCVRRKILTPFHLPSQSPAPSG